LSFRRRFSDDSIALAPCLSLTSAKPAEGRRPHLQPPPTRPERL
jgi:hypothetical protein